MKEKVSDLGYKNEKILHMSQYMRKEKCIEAIFKENMAASSPKFKKEILSFNRRLYLYTDTQSTCI